MARSGEEFQEGLPLSDFPHPLPKRLWLVRHAESLGNVACETALAANALTISIAGRDADVGLSPAGTEQAAALGAWFGSMKGGPDVILCSPYRRAQQTAQRIADHVAVPGDCFKLDERLREKEFGIIDGLTRAGIEQRYPDIAASRTLVGKFYHRPPGGESWCDVILRLRSVIASLSLEHAGRNVLIVTHQVVVLCMRYLLESMTEEEILAIDRQGDVLNCAVTEYVCEKEKMVLKRYNWVSPIAKAGAPVTAEPPRRTGSSP